MGRELKRVARDFKWPLHQVWSGYLNPYRAERCRVCDATGYGPAVRVLADLFYGGWEHELTQEEVDLLVEKGRLFDLTHVFTPGEGWKPREPAVRPTPADVSRWSRGRGLGHDAINRSYLIRARAERLGLKPYYCTVCSGEGKVWPPSWKALHEAWTRTEPPAGDGYQLWETTSEGSPITPVFKTLWQLCDWAAGNASPFGDERITAEAWHQMLSADVVAYTDPTTGIVFL